MIRVFTDFHLFCGSGGGALGFSWATRTYGSLRDRCPYVALERE